MEEDFFSLESETDTIIKNFSQIQREDLIRYLEIDLNPDSLLDYERCEAVLMVSEILIRKTGNQVLPLPHEIQSLLPEKNFNFLSEDYQKAALAVKKIGENGSELDFEMEHQGGEIYSRFCLSLQSMQNLLKNAL